MDSPNNLNISDHYNNYHRAVTFSPTTGETSGYQTAAIVKYQQQQQQQQQQNPKRKRSSSTTTTTATTKRTKFETIDGVIKPKPSRKPDPSAPKITRPCTECGKKFWSEKALFGHMRCHPERQWRGINPPPNIRRRRSITSLYDDASSSSTVVTEEDHEIATCLLLLANGAAFSEQGGERGTEVSGPDTDMAEGYGLLGCMRFECSSCKKVFGSHQALGGHRASHKNVKGCYAITKNEGDEGAEEEGGSGYCDGLGVTDDDRDDQGLLLGQHKCGICARVFSSGQALGGHKRCHWENNNNKDQQVRVIDLNLPAGLEEEDQKDEVLVAPRYESGLISLDLRLGL